MNIVVVSGIAWRQDRNAALAVVGAAVDGAADAKVILDYESVRRAHASAKNRAETMVLRQMNMEDVLRRFADRYEIDPHALAEALEELRADINLMLDAGGYPAHVIRDLAVQMRRAWYPLPEWPGLLVIVANDSDLVDVAEAFFGAFYVRPRGLTAHEARLISAEIMKRAAMARMFGFRQGRLQRFYGHVFGELLRAKDAGSTPWD